MKRTLLAAILLSAGLLAGTGSAAAAAAPPGTTIEDDTGKALVADQYIVRLRDGSATGASPAAVPALAARHGVTARQSYQHAFQGFAAAMSPAQAAALARDPAVASVRPDQYGSLMSTVEPQSWGLDRIDQRYLPLSNSYTYDSGSRGAGVTVYILDTGLTNQLDFNGRATMGPNFRAEWPGEQPDSADDCGHGTHIAGTVGSTTYGVARAVTIVAARVSNCDWLRPFNVSDVIEGIDWVIAQHQAGQPAVLNLSLGALGGNDDLDAAVEAALADGISVVAAAGNSTSNPCGQDGDSPARVPGVITVGSIGKDDHRSEFSNFGSCVDLYAPGESIKSWDQFLHQTRLLSGTSMAAPHAAGVVARFLQERPGSSPALVQDVLVNNASYVGGTKILHASHGKQPPPACEIGDFTTTDVPIPDAGSGVAMSQLEISGCNWNGNYTTFAGTLRVIWGVAHPRPADLRIELVSALQFGPTYLLRGPGAAGAGTWGQVDLDVPWEARNGTWRLRVTDTVSGQTGYISAWSLQF